MNRAKRWANNNEQLWSAYYVPGIMLSDLHMFFNSQNTPMTYYPDFTLIQGFRASKCYRHDNNQVCSIPKPVLLTPILYTAHWVWQQTYNWMIKSSQCCISEQCSSGFPTLIFRRYGEIMLQSIRNGILQVLAFTLKIHVHFTFHLIIYSCLFKYIKVKITNAKK